jgi:putative transcriptional regulator
VIYYYHSESHPLFLLNVFSKNEKTNLSKAERKRNAESGASAYYELPEDGAEMKNTRAVARRKPSAGSRIIESLRQAVDWAEGKEVSVRVSSVDVPTVDVREVRRGLRLSQAAFAAKFGFPPATLRNWEQGRTRPDGPARVLLAVIAQHPEAVEDALRPH